MAINSEFQPIYIKLPPSKIVLLKFLLESYEGIAELRTLDKDQALVVLLALKDTLNTVRNLLESEKEILCWEELQNPPNLEGDWLLHNTQED